MSSGDTITGSLADSLPTLIMSARIVREQKKGMPGLVDRQTLGEGIGLNWNEVTFAKLDAQSITETTILDNPQQLSDTLFSITPKVVGIHTVITDRVALRISKNAFAQTGKLAQNAVERLKDEDGITVLDGAVTSLAGGGTTLTSGHIFAAVSQISSNTTEPGNPPFRLVLHGFQIKDIQDEILAGVGTYPVGAGLTADVFAQGFMGMIGSAQLYENGNIPIVGSNAKGGVFAEDAIVLVQGRTPWVEPKRLPDLGGGATALYIYDEYAYGERSAGNWLVEIHSDASTPTS